MQTETLRHLLTTPALLSTPASLLLMSSSLGERLFRSLAPGEDSTAALVLPNSDLTEEFGTTTKKKEKLNGYL
jgi:hypothetical protein